MLDVKNLGKSLGVDTEKFHKASEAHTALAQEIASKVAGLAVDMMEQNELSARAVVHLITAGTGAALGMTMGIGLATTKQLPENAQEWVDEELTALVDTFGTNMRASRLLGEMTAMQTEGSA